MVSYLLLADTYPKIRLIEFIGNVPSQSTKLPPFLNQSMEETQAEQEFSPQL